jgi:hypothetical protein
MLYFSKNAHFCMFRQEMARIGQVKSLPYKRGITGSNPVGLTLISSTYEVKFVSAFLFVSQNAPNLLMIYTLLINLSQSDFF